ncbi:MAG: transporter substrate-binding domain-containing protein [Gemmobacter sp.]
MRLYAKISGIAAGLICASTLASQAQVACEQYRATVGDTLLGIAMKAYGTKEYQKIYGANREAIGSNPDLLRVGTLLTIPCADGSLPATAEQQAPDAETIAAQAARVAEQAKAQTAMPITLITGNGFLPFTDERLPGRGLFTELVETSVLRADAEQKLNVIFINDWASHLDTLLPLMAFDGSFPWTKPDCSQPAALSADDRYRCENYNFSEPFYEVVDGLFSRKGSGFAEALSHDELKGTRICRPEGLSTAHLASVGLAEPDVTFLRPERVATCFEALMAGQVDIVAVESQQATDTIAMMKLQDEVVENPNLGEVNALHVVVHKQNPRGREVLDVLNAGLGNMLESGEWYEIVSGALKRQDALRVN